ncbi:MAG: hypothetical protein R3C19_08515 [Planctomycetaceae bacterium]
MTNDRNPYEAPRETTTPVDESRKPGAIAVIWIALVSIIAGLFAFGATCLVGGVISGWAIAEIAAALVAAISPVIGVLVTSAVRKALWRAYSK